MLSRLFVRRYAIKTIKVPPMADSITEGTLVNWTKKVGEYVSRDEHIATIETDKVDLTVNATEGGEITKFFANDGETVQVGGNFYEIETDAKPSASNESAPPAVKIPEPEKKEIKIEQPIVVATPISKPSSFIESRPSTMESTHVPFIPQSEDSIPGILPGSRQERRVKMNRMRLRIAERLKESQNTAASLTTFNEIDMSGLINLRKLYKDDVLERHAVKLGYMSAFIKASAMALQHVPEVNARIENDAIVYQDYVDISVAVATPKGLVTPVLRNCESISMLQIEKALLQMAKKAKENKIQVEDMAGGTFTISNGGVFGSLMGTPILNSPQSGILGMHAIKDRAVVVDGKIEVRPMMYIALTYDHRLVDGREAVTFLKTVKQFIEDPQRMLLDI